MSVGMGAQCPLLHLPCKCVAHPEICMRHSMAMDQGSTLAGKLHHMCQQELNWLSMTNTWFCGLPGCDYLSIVHLTLLRSMRIQFLSPKSIAFSAVFPFALPPTLEEKWYNLPKTTYSGKVAFSVHTPLCVHVPSKCFH